MSRSSSASSSGVLTNFHILEEDHHVAQHVDVARLNPVILSSSSNHCVVKIVASSEILTNFQLRVVQDLGAVPRTETRLTILSNLIDKNTLNTNLSKIVEIKITFC